MISKTFLTIPLSFQHQQQPSVVAHQQPSVVAQLREQRLPEKHFRPTPQEPHEDESPSKKPRLITLPPNQQVQHIPVKTLLNSGGGIVAVSKPPIQPVHPGGLLQIAKPILQSGGRVQVNSKTHVPGIPVPSMAGVLTGIKSGPSQALFSLPGKRTEIVPGMPGPSKENISTIPATQSELKNEVKIEIENSKEGGFLRPNSLPLTPGSFKPKKHVMIIGGDTLVSPETPRPRKSYMLQYQNGTAYTTLGFKSSTKVYYTTIFHQQPMYVANKPRISMYSNWRVVSKVILKI